MCQSLVKIVADELREPETTTTASAELSSLLSQTCRYLCVRVIMCGAWLVRPALSLVTCVVLQRPGVGWENGRDESLWQITKLRRNSQTVS